MSGIIESTPSTVAKAVPLRIPKYAGMNTSRMPTTAIASVHQAMKVLIGVKPEVVSSPNRSAR